MYTYSLHFIARAKERGISLDHIESILAGKEDALTVPSRKDPDVELVMGFVEGKGIVAILNKTTKVIITVRRMSKKKERLFWEA
ncbi:hypothetical protein ACFLZV_06665 [Candidatus Margulisiibacteriota bacterium]